MHERVVTRVKKIERWLPPLTEFLKFNMDEASTGNWGPLVHKEVVLYDGMK